MVVILERHLSGESIEDNVNYNHDCVTQITAKKSFYEYAAFFRPQCFMYNDKDDNDHHLFDQNR